MALRLGQKGFEQLLPDSIREDPTIAAVAKVLDDVLRSTSLAIPNLLIPSRLVLNGGNDDDFSPPMKRLIDEAGGLRALSEEVLDLLAWQFHVENYEVANTLETKRQAVLTAINVHRKKGTPWAVRTAMEATTSCPTKISEWFSYGGDPYFFRVVMNVYGVVFDAKNAEDSIRIILENKNVRSWLEFLMTTYEQRCPVYTATAGISRTVVRPRIYFKTPDPVEAPVYVAFAGKDRTRFYPSPVSPSKETPHCQVRFAFADADRTRFHSSPVTPSPQAPRASAHYALAMSGGTSCLVSPSAPMPETPRATSYIGLAATGKTWSIVYVK